MTAGNAAGRRRPPKTKARIGGVSALAEGAEHTEPVSPLAGASWPITPAVETVPSEPAPAWPGMVKLADLADNPDNPRETLRELEGLAETIREDGVLQDIVVVPRDIWLAVYPHHAEHVGERPFVIHHGHRRRHAAELAGLDEVPVKVRESAESAEERALIENLHQDGLSPLEEARGLAKLMELRSFSGREAARRLGKSSGWASQRLTLLNLRPDLQEALEDGRLSVRDARVIGKLPPEEQYLPELAPEVEPPGPTPASSPASAGESDGGAQEGAYPVSTPAEPRGKTPKPAGAGGPYVTLPLGSPTEVAATLRAQMRPEHLEALVELLTATTAR
ncbi:hypothetical protein Ppa06_57470 [Planomonospora parontospora subsp. parontospora]|uniref:ParB-like N-terminal domain-containing protein n=2 Tax=Planomonospora parontospora TaxID=58119 RepID=A0AA37BLW9_9ACTN|nr:ParB/RepB/Spo0J family partition protein [Planomonospora parontospora]GGK90827.1 hypothetical protein GCM10010126_57840 [Planomonospora parontospora]GII11949.1 hypothetical protein Ppa06_57470 [Planomonospora parontospora subsp. parontospora]